MASGDIIYQINAAYIIKDDVAINVGTTVFQEPGPSDVVTVENHISGVQETVFDTSKTYDVIIKEH